MDSRAHVTPPGGSMLRAETEPAEPWARLEAAPDGGTRLRLGGRLVPGWAGTLAFGLSRMHVTILRGCACCMSRGKWTAFFDLRALTGAPALEAIDYPALVSRLGSSLTKRDGTLRGEGPRPCREPTIASGAPPPPEPHPRIASPSPRDFGDATQAFRREERSTPAALRLERYVLGPIVGGALQLAIYSQDCVALLGDLLDRVAGLSLFPEEMHVEAQPGLAEGRFRFRALGGGAPSEEARCALESLLASWLLPPVRRPLGATAL